MGTQPTKTLEELRQEFEENRIVFILTELETAKTFCDLALSSTNEEKRRRNIANGRTGYRTARQIAVKANLQGKIKEEFERHLGEVRDLLRELGQEV